MINCALPSHPQQVFRPCPLYKKGIYYFFRQRKTSSLNIFVDFTQYGKLLLVGTFLREHVELVVGRFSPVHTE